MNKKYNFPADLFDTSPTNFSEMSGEIYTSEFLAILQLRYLATAPDSQDEDFFVHTIDQNWFPGDYLTTSSHFEGLIKNIIIKIKSISDIKEAFRFINGDPGNFPLVEGILELSILYYKEMRKMGADPNRMYNASLVIRSFLRDLKSFTSGNIGEEEFTEKISDFKEFKI